MSAGNILVVDDDQNLIELIGLKLHSGGYEVTSASSGVDAPRLPAELSCCGEFHALLFLLRHRTRRRRSLLLRLRQAGLKPGQLESDAVEADT